MKCERFRMSRIEDAPFCRRSRMRCEVGYDLGYVEPNKDYSCECVYFPKDPRHWRRDDDTGATRAPTIPNRKSNDTAKENARNKSNNNKKIVSERFIESNIKDALCICGETSKWQLLDRDVFMFGCRHRLVWMHVLVCAVCCVHHRLRKKMQFNLIVKAISKWIFFCFCVDAVGARVEICRSQKKRRTKKMCTVSSRDAMR